MFLRTQSPGTARAQSPGATNRGAAPPDRASARRVDADRGTALAAPASPATPATGSRRAAVRRDGRSESTSLPPRGTGAALPSDVPVAPGRATSAVPPGGAPPVAPRRAKQGAASAANGATSAPRAAPPPPPLSQPQPQPQPQSPPRARSARARGPSTTTPPLAALLERRRREFESAAPVTGFLHLRSPEDAAIVTQEAIAVFGISLGGAAARTSPVREARTLHVSNIPRGLTPDATVAALGALLEGAGLGLSLVDADALRHGMISNGEVLIEFETHGALEAAHELRGAKLVASAVYNEGGAMVIGWASAAEWRKGKPRTEGAQMIR